MAEDDVLVERLTSYSRALAGHSAAIEEAYRYAEESAQHLRHVYGARAWDDFLVLWERVTEARNRYLDGAGAIQEMLDTRLATLA